MTQYTNIGSDKDFIISEAGRCVACNLCLPYCPTYQLTQLETESPRGRISLLSAVASGQLAATDKLNDLVHHCLLCRACETHCPSSVAFARLMDKGRYLLNQKLVPASRLKVVSNNFVDHLLRHPELLHRASRFAWLLKFLPNLGKKSRRFSDYLASVQQHPNWQVNYPAETPGKQVSLFLGCISRSMDVQTLDDAIYVLNRIGFSVNIPRNQSCCGALSLHAGREDAAIEMMNKNTQAFATTDTPIIHTASGCGINLETYSDHIEDTGFSSRISEISHFLDRHWPDAFQPSTRKFTVLLHSPCSMENSSADADAPFRLLSRFPDIEIRPMSSQYNCCGAAGTKMLTDYEVSSRLREPPIDQISREMPGLVVTSNIGCALHLSEGLRKAGLDIAVKHPISLVADALRDTGDI